MEPYCNLFCSGVRKTFRDTQTLLFGISGQLRKEGLYLLHNEDDR